MNYAIVIEHAPGSNYSGYVPDLPGVAATGDRIAEVYRLLQECVEAHLAAMRADGDPIPPPSTIVEYVESPG